MTDTNAIKRVLDRAEEEQFDRKVKWGDLKTVTEFGKTDERVMVSEGSSSKWANRLALNFVSVCIWDPQWTFQALREEAPNNGEAMLEGRDFGIFNCTSPVIDMGNVDTCRTRGFVKSVADLAADLVNDDRQENYTYRVYRNLAQSETRLNTGTNPVKAVKEFYMVKAPVEIIGAEPDEEEEEESPEVASAADW